MGITGKNKSALHEQEGIAQPDSFNTAAAQKLMQNRKKKQEVMQLFSGIQAGDKTALSRSITLIESTAPHHQAQAKDLIALCLPLANKSQRIGITGVPGVGKSTFIEAFGKLLTSKNRKVAVLAVDPSSSISKGSILGDKTRMMTTPLFVLQLVEIHLAAWRAKPARPSYSVKRQGLTPLL
jgi:LAO/AO transport system kinase